NRDVAGFPVRLPSVDINTVGAGGGSIAWFDRDGLLKVGPQSAGADPGPACYGRGGMAPTVSDANLILGRLSPSLLGGEMTLDEGRARAAMAPLADRLGFSVERTAHGVLAIVVANMVRAIRTISIERGHDPRDFALMAFGGAGALHAGDVARALDMGRVIIPPAPGILCAQGLVVSDLKEDFVAAARMLLAAPAMGALTVAADGLRAAAEAWFSAEAVAPERRRVPLALDLRYRRQNFELTIDANAPDDPAQIAPLETLLARFYADHDRTYGFHTTEDPVEVVNIRLTAIGTADTPPPAAGDGTGAAPTGERAVWFTAEEATVAPLYQRAGLAPGAEFVGPAIIDQTDATTVVHPGDRVTVDAAGNLLIEVST
ncbi:MAG: hydantoinase/oxoprolinase family protein, partial [Pseudomonadota bacterium]|nr:hydantoinase/oxoprolinase family protein [Pseudomonadota bacterium]